MTNEMKYEGGESFDAPTILQHSKEMRFADRMNDFTQLLDSSFANYQSMYMRLIDSPADREVTVLDALTGERRRMLMFGANNYLGLATHPRVKDAVRDAAAEYGVGLSGPPLFNGYTSLHRQLEERLSALKHSEETLLFSTGYSANLGLMTSLTTSRDRVLFDDYHHASLRDGLRMAKCHHRSFTHNDLSDLEEQITTRPNSGGDTFVCVEGVYSMDGDLAPLPQIVPLCWRHGAVLIIDDAHGTGVMGVSGSGTAEHFGLERDIDITMGTFSKAFGVTGGFVSSSRSIVSYMRVFARSYMFSASLPPIVVAAVLAGVDIIEEEPWLRDQLRRNVARAAAGFRALGFDVNPEAAIIALRVPEGMNIRQAALQFHEAGVFVNCVEFPAVPLDQQRFRVSLMATHTDADIDRLLECTADVWAKCATAVAAGGR
jgi:glycine C-acetyltransferase